MKLNDYQQKIVDTPPGTNIIVRAGPGSGKTTLMAHRYLALVKAGVKPEKILVVAFTRKAAGEIEDKIAEKVVLSKIAREQISTLHSFCTRRLHLIWKRRGENPRYPWRLSPGGPKKPEYWLEEESESLTTAVLDANTILKRQLVPKVEDIGYYGYKTALVWNIWRKYVKYLKDHNLIDYAGTIALYEQYLYRDRMIRFLEQSAFQEVILDEGQDITNQMMRILTTISQPTGWNNIYGANNSR